MARRRTLSFLGSIEALWERVAKSTVTREFTVLYLG
jgi:hypothetical protein